MVREPTFVCLPGVTVHPAAEWAVQAARQFTWTLTGRAGQVRYLIRDRAGRFTGGFGAVFAAGGIKVLRTAPQCPRMNAYAGRVVRAIRAGCTRSDADHWAVAPPVRAY